MPSGDLNPFDLTLIKGFPDYLKIYRIARSKYWQYRYFVPGRDLIRKSTYCTDKSEAVGFAKGFYENILLEQRSVRLTSQASFGSFAEKLMDHQKSLVTRGELDPRMITEERAKLNRYVLPTIGLHCLAAMVWATNLRFVQDGFGYRRLHAESIMVADPVVLFKPDTDDDPSLACGREPLGVETFAAECSVEALVVAVLPGRSRIDPDGLNADTLKPVPEWRGRKPGSIVGTKVLRLAALEQQWIKRLRHIGREPVLAATPTHRASRVYSSSTVNILQGRPLLSLSCTRSIARMWFG